MSEYTFDTHEADTEYQRLLLIQKAFDEKSKAHLLKAGLRAGMKCLEVGLGAGSVAEWMSEQIGKEGRLIGVDRNCAHIKPPVDYEVIEGDILELDIPERFDLIHLRYVLIHNIHADKILHKLFDLLRSGGKLIVEEPDFTLAKWIDAKDLDACKRVNSAMCKMFEQKGLKPRYGAISHLALESVGFRIDEMKSYFHLNSGGEDISRMMALSTQALRDEYEQTGLCNADDIEAYINACGDSDSLGVYYATNLVIGVKDEPCEETQEAKQLEPVKEGIYEAIQSEQISACLPVMKTLREGVEEELFVARVQEQRREGYRLFYYLRESKVIAVAGCRISQNLAWGRHLYIDDLVSLSEERSLGYGGKLMEFLKQMAQEEGCKQIHLDSGVQRFEAHRFYLNKGFRISSHHFTMEL